jgi:hypothetical protein
MASRNLLADRIRSSDNRAMELLNMGPFGVLFYWGAAVSVVLAILTWRRASIRTAALTTLTVAAIMIAWQTVVLENGDHRRWLLHASFVAVPSALLFGGSRLRLFSRHSWMMLLVGPLVFAACYVGICECAYRVFNA